MTLEDVRAQVDGWIEVSERGTSLLLRIGGELDAASCQSIEPAVFAALASTRSVLIDLAEVSFCDATGVAMFIAAHQKATLEGAALAIYHVPRHIRRLFEVASLDTLIELVP